MAKELPGFGLFIGALALLSSLVSAPSYAAVGRTAGIFNVSNSGAATYTIPIFTQPGPRGIQPSVALVYNSDAGLGYVGKGWSIEGLSAISACNKTIAQDGRSGPVFLNTERGLDKWIPAWFKLPSREAEVQAI